MLAPRAGSVHVTARASRSAFTRFLAPDIGFRPYRRSAPSQARSGTVVADVGRDVCFKDTGDAQGCEFVVPGVTGRLTRTASSITLYAGVFDGGAAVSAILTAYRADGTVAGASGAVPIGTSFTTGVTVTSAAADIARFYLTVEGPGALNASLGFDDLTLEFPANSLPDISVSAPTQITTLRQGAGTDIPIDVTRLNGSNGPVTLPATRRTCTRSSSPTRAWNRGSRPPSSSPTTRPTSCCRSCSACARTPTTNSRPGRGTRVRDALADLSKAPDFGNARTVRNVFEAAVRHHAWRLRDDIDVSVSEMRTLTVDDVVAAMA